jgi:hypothetical protein
VHSTPIPATVASASYAARLALTIGGTHNSHDLCQGRIVMSSRGCFDYRCKITCAIALTVVLFFAGCAPVAFTTVQEKMAHGQYAEAHEELLELAQRSDLTPTQRREVTDDLCLSEFMIGRPSYPLAEQRQRCADAVAQPGSDSASVLARIDEQIRDNAAVEVETALKAGDLAGAELAALGYANSPGADTSTMQPWATQMWQLADQQISDHVTGSKKHLGSAVADLRSQYPQVVGMNVPTFEQWARKSSTDGSIPLIARNELNDATLMLWVDEDELPSAALHLDQFASINSALSARCRCSARTRISDARNDLPAYLVYLDTDLGESDVFILPGARVGQPQTATR